jgi:hypothetical protein
MTENFQLEQSVSEWKDEALGDSNPPRSLEEIAFILSAGVFGAVLAYGGIRMLPECCFFGTLPAFLFGAVGGAAGAAIGAAKGGPIGGIYGALLGTFLGMVAVPIIEMAVVPIVEIAVPWVFGIVYFVFGFVFGFAP